MLPQLPSHAVGRHCCHHHAVVIVVTTVVVVTIVVICGLLPTAQVSDAELEEILKIGQAGATQSESMRQYRGVSSWEVTHIAV